MIKNSVRKPTSLIQLLSPTGKCSQTKNRFSLLESNRAYKALFRQAKCSAVDGQHKMNSMTYFGGCLTMLGQPPLPQVLFHIYHGFPFYVSWNFSVYGCLSLRLSLELVLWLFSSVSLLVLSYSDCFLFYLIIF